MENYLKLGVVVLVLLVGSVVANEGGDAEEISEEITDHDIVKAVVEVSEHLTYHDQIFAVSKTSFVGSGFCRSTKL